MHYNPTSQPVSHKKELKFEICTQKFWKIIRHVRAMLPDQPVLFLFTGERSRVPLSPSPAERTCSAAGKWTRYNSKVCRNSSQIAIRTRSSIQWGTTVSTWNSKATTGKCILTKHEQNWKFILLTWKYKLLGIVYKYQLLLNIYLALGL